MRSRLICRNCGAEISEEIEILSSKDPSVPVPEFEDRQPVCPPGRAYKSYEPLMRSHDPDRPAPLEFAPQLWLNPADIESFSALVDDPHRLNGCCGLDGCDGPNICCRACKAEIGTKQSDCWTPLIFVPDPGATKLEKVGP